MKKELKEDNIPQNEDSSNNYSYRFNDFEFTPKGPILRFRGEILKDIDKKTLDVLRPLIVAGGGLVSHEEIISVVWSDSVHGVTPARVNQYMSKLQKQLNAYEPETKFLENIRGRGYRFAVPVARVEQRVLFPATSVVEIPLRSVISDGELRDLTVSPPERRRSVAKYAGFAVILFGLVSGVAWIGVRGDDKEEIERVVRESQMYESLVLYRDPETFQELDLDKYWTAETDLESNYDRKNIRTGVRKLIADGRIYGPETKNQKFEIQSIEVNENRDLAVVKTLEEWFIAEYRKDGSLIRNKTVGPYFVSYIVRSVEGKWLIEKSTTARANPPTPSIYTIEPVSVVGSGRQFFVDISGNGFVPSSVFVRVIGPGCREDIPCTVPNGALRLHSTLSEAMVSNVPLTLASGNFIIQIQNGESTPSNSLTITVP